ncbi:flavin reductase family protein [Candidatus Hydrogenedentota bacterium]
MKHEFSIEKPEGLKELWPGYFSVFCWLDEIITTPHWISMITTRKANGKSNACLDNSVGFLGGQGAYSVVMSVTEGGHTYANIMQEKEWCICIPSWAIRKQCNVTIECNHEDNDEILDAGLTVEDAVVVRAPRIAECSVCVECRFSWSHKLAEGERLHIIAGKVVHVGVDEQALTTDTDEKLERMGLHYYVHDILNPLTLERSGYCSAQLTLLDESKPEV